MSIVLDSPSLDSNKTIDLLNFELQKAYYKISQASNSPSSALTEGYMTSLISSILYEINEIKEEITLEEIKEYFEDFIHQIHEFYKKIEAQEDEHEEKLKLESEDFEKLKEIFNDFQEKILHTAEFNNNINLDNLDSQTASDKEFEQLHLDQKTKEKIDKLFKDENNETHIVCEEQVKKLNKMKKELGKEFTVAEVKGYAKESLGKYISSKNELDKIKVNKNNNQKIENSKYINDDFGKISIYKAVFLLELKAKVLQKNIGLSSTNRKDLEAKNAQTYVNSAPLKDAKLKLEQKLENNSIKQISAPAA